MGRQACYVCARVSMRVYAWIGKHAVCVRVSVCVYAWIGKQAVCASLCTCESARLCMGGYASMLRVHALSSRGTARMRDPRGKDGTVAGDPYKRTCTYTGMVPRLQKGRILACESAHRNTGTHTHTLT